jgi:tetratricopeptide (TPR) repeat protein
MGKFFVPSTARTPVDRVRESLDRAEILISRLRDSGPQVLELLHLLDQGARALAELEAAGVDVRAERVRFETVQRQLRRRQALFLAEAGAAFGEERAAVQPDRARWWWFLDEAVAQERARRLRRWLTWALAAALLLSGAWWAYDRFIAPPPEVRQAFQLSANGEALADEGDLRAALAEFEAAAALTPEDPEPWIWQGVIHFELNERDEARADFETARALYETDFDFLLDRGRAYLRLGNLAVASADIEQAILEDPDSGQSYLLRAGIAADGGDYAAAVADLDRAAELAQAAGDTQLEAVARAQRALVIQLQMFQLATPSLGTPSDES